MIFTSQGQAIEVACPSTLKTEHTTNLTTNNSVTGHRRASYFGGVTPLRAWTVDVSATHGEELGLLEAISTGALGADHLGFIPCGAEHQNLLPPGASLLATVPGATRRPVTVAADGKAYPGGLTTPTTTLIASQIPWAFPGQPITLSIVGKDGGTCSIRWLKANLDTIRNDGVTASSSEYTRTHINRTAPAEATYFDLHINGAVAAPAITLGTTLRPWSVGKTAKSVVVEPSGSQLLAAWDAAQVLSTISYTVTEVGKYV